MTRRPHALVVLAPALNRNLVTAELQERVERLCDLLVADPVSDLADPRAAKALGSVEVLITGWGCPRLDAESLDRMPRLQAAFHAAGTVKNHVTPACFERGIRITSAARANAIPVAEFTVAAILLANKRAFRLQRWYREHRKLTLWSHEFPGLGNHRKVIGLVGASRIGSLVAGHLQGFGFEVLIHDPYVSEAEATALGASACELEDLLRRSDVVSLHAPSLPETRHMIDRGALALLRDGCVLVNTARGALIDHIALTEELVSGRIDAVLDTTDPELLPADSPLYDLDNVFLTPHIAGSQGGETSRMFSHALDELERFVAGQPLLDEIRLEDWGRIA